MKLIRLPYALTVCKLADVRDIKLDDEIFFIGKTDEGLSLVCRTEYVPEKTIEREDGWRGFRIEGKLDFSLIGILSKICTLLAENKIGIFAISTYNTDYIFVKEKDYERALQVLEDEGYEIEPIL